MRIDPTIFATLLARSPISEGVKQEVLQALPQMTTTQITKLYRIFEQAHTKREQERLKLEVHMADEWASFEKQLEEIRSKLEKS